MYLSYSYNLIATHKILKTPYLGAPLLGGKNALAKNTGYCTGSAVTSEIILDILLIIIIHQEWGFGIGGPIR